MQWRNREVPTFSGSAGSNRSPAIVEVMELIDRDGNVLLSLTKDVAAAFTASLASGGTLQADTLTVTSAVTMPADVIYTGLRTTEPETAGLAWNDAGTIKVSDGV